MKLKSYEVEVRAIVHVSEAEDEEDAMEQAEFLVEMSPDIGSAVAEFYKEIN